MFITTKKRMKQLVDREKSLGIAVDKLQEEVYDLKVSKRQLQLDNKIKIEDIEHMTRIKEEKLDIEFDKKVIKVERKKDGEVLTIKNEYRDKVITLLEEGKKELASMYTQILERLPDINVAIKGKV